MILVILVSLLEKWSFFSFKETILGQTFATSQLVAQSVGVWWIVRMPPSISAAWAKWPQPGGDGPTGARSQTSRRERAHRQSGVSREARSADAVPDLSGSRVAYRLWACGKRQQGGRRSAAQRSRHALGTP